MSYRKYTTKFEVEILSKIVEPRHFYLLANKRNLKFYFHCAYEDMMINKV